MNSVWVHWLSSFEPACLKVLMGHLITTTCYTRRLIMEHLTEEDLCM